ncbi:MAG: YkgJ family cysteine cluster protein [Selenomonadaceae bacterium]|nr:YkgJ family cysteine cluster protein [Selenomonadaceae bacterium]
MFPCDKCGLCCRLVNHSNLANEKGVCKYLDEKSNLCKIYEKRPLFCRVDEYYDKYCKDDMTREAFYALNKNYCQMIKRQKGVV